MSSDQRIKVEEQPGQRDRDTSSELPPKDQEGILEISPGTVVEPTRFGDWERAGRCIDF